MEGKFKELKTRLAEINDLDSAAALLGWDQSTYMPPGGAEARGRQMATLKRLSQEKFSDPAIGKLLDALEPYAESLPYDSDEASLVRVTRIAYERATKVPPQFMGDLYAHTARSYQVWAKARPENDFTAVEPMLEKTLDFSRRLADYFPGYQHIADPLIDFFDYGMSAQSIRALFAELRTQLVPLVKAITEQPLVDDSCLRLGFPKQKQLEFSEEVIKQLGYDYERGRMDETHHPFTTKFSLGDVRITVRHKEDFLSECLFSAIHEAGHAIYEQGIRMDLEATTLAEGTSSGVHESQSRLWENLVGRGRDFWIYYYPRLQEVFPQQLGAVPLDTFYRAINKVEPSLIRTDADEVTYNLHIMIRFDLELAMLEGALPVKDLPDAWNARYRKDLGIVPPNDTNGVMQDVHWYFGLIGGMFQGYTLGNILGAQFFEMATQAHPEIPAQIQAGQFDSLHGWMTENIYQYGSMFTTQELVERITGGPIRIEPYIRYLKRKYGEIYGISF